MFHVKHHFINSQYINLNIRIIISIFFYRYINKILYVSRGTLLSHSIINIQSKYKNHNTHIMLINI